MVQKMQSAEAASTGVVKLNALVSIMGALDSDVLAELRHRYPDKSEELRGDVLLGDESNDLDFLLDVAERGLEVVTRSLEPCTLRVRKRLERAEKIHLLSGVVAAVTGAGILSAVFASKAGAAVQSEARQSMLWAAGVNFTATVCTLVVGHLRKPSYGGGAGLIDAFETMVRTRIDAEKLLGEIRWARQAGTDMAFVRGAARTANKLTADVQGFLLRYG